MLGRYLPMAFMALSFVLIQALLDFLQTTRLKWGKHLQTVHMMYWPSFSILLGMKCSFQNFWVIISVILMRQARHSLSSLMTCLLDKSVLAASNHTMSTICWSREFLVAFFFFAFIWAAKFLLSWYLLQSLLTNDVDGMPCPSLVRVPLCFDQTLPRHPLAGHPSCPPALLSMMCSTLFIRFAWRSPSGHSNNFHRHSLNL